MDRLNPDTLAAVHRICQWDPDMVPGVFGGTLYAFNATSPTASRLPATISARHFVLNMEALGNPFQLFDFTDGLSLGQTFAFASDSPHWRERSHNLRGAFWQVGRDRSDEVVDFLLSRGDEPMSMARSYSAPVLRRVRA